MTLNAEQRRNALAILNRLAAQDAAARGWLAEAVRRGLPGSLGPAVEVALDTGHPMSDVLSELASEASLDIVTDLWRLVPARTTALRRTAATALGRLTTSASLPEDPVSAVTMLTDRAERLVEMGAHVPSVAIAQQAVDRLAEPDLPTPELAALAPRVWQVMSNSQRVTGDNEGAVASSRLALRLTTIMCWGTPCLTVAGAHVTLATRLAAAGRDLEARGQFDTGLGMAERLLKDPAWYFPENDGSRRKMFITYEDAVQSYALVRAGLAADWGIDPKRTFYFEAGTPTQIVEVISAALTGLCQCLNRLGDLPGAADAAARAVTLMRDLRDADADGHGSGLAVALVLLAEQSGRLGRRAESLRAAEEAVALLRKSVLDSGGAFVDEYARALTCLMSAMELGKRTIGSIIGQVEELVQLFESADGTEALERGGPRLAAVLQWLENYARFAERMGDPETALGMARLVVRGRSLLRGIDAKADVELAVALNLVSQLLASLGRAREAIAAAEDAVRYADATTRAVMLNNLSIRLFEAGDRGRACNVAHDGLAALDPVSVAAENVVGGWQVAVSLLCTAINNHGNGPLPRHVVAILREVLASAPVPPADDAFEKRLPAVAVLAFVAETRESPSGALEILELLASAQSRAGLGADIRADYATVTGQLAGYLADDGQPDTAASVYRLLAGVARASGEETPRIEQAKAATLVMVAFASAGRYQEATDVAADAEDVLRSPEYLAARERDLGQPTAPFLEALDQILGR